MPCVASGFNLVYMDPSKSVFTSEAMQYEFTEPSNKKLIKTHHDFASFSRLGGRYWKDGFTSGSLFKFTLRKEPSLLSQVCYDNERFEELMEKFLDEAFLTLIFLKNVKKLSFYVIEENESQLNEVFSINTEIESSGMKEKEMFSNRIKQHVTEKNFKTTETLDHTLQLVQRYRNEENTFTYAISEYFGFSGNNPEFVSMMTDDELSYVPLIAVAFPIECNDVGGHIFAALPLPLQVKCMTGMPVHVNGFFALGQDRKDLKWRTLSEGKHSNDKTVNWNVCLITELLPIVYSNLIKYLITQPKGRVSDAYKAWPCKTNLDKKWTMFLEHYYNIMFREKCIYSNSSRKWVSINEVYFIDGKIFDSKDQITTIMELIANFGYDVEMICPNITDSYLPEKLNWVNNALVRLIIKSNQTDYQKLPMASKTQVLQFLCKRPSDWNELSRFKLFPYVSGGYGPLNNTNVVLDREIRMLLPNRDRTLDQCIFDNAQPLLLTFKEWIKKGFYFTFFYTFLLTL